MAKVQCSCTGCIILPDKAAVNGLVSHDNTCTAISSISRVSGLHKTWRYYACQRQRCSREAISYETACEYRGEQDFTNLSNLVYVGQLLAEDEFGLKLFQIIRRSSRNDSVELQDRIQNCLRDERRRLSFGLFHFWLKLDNQSGDGQKCNRVGYFSRLETRSGT